MSDLCRPAESNTISGQEFEFDGKVCLKLRNLPRLLLLLLLLSRRREISRRFRSEWTSTRKHVQQRQLEGYPPHALNDVCNGRGGTPTPAMMDAKFSFHCDRFEHYSISSLLYLRFPR